MRIAILGAGNVGGGLATAFAAIGHSVVFGVRDPDSEKCRRALAAAPGSTAASQMVAVESADVVGVALRPDAVPGVIGQLPPLGDRVVIDTMNRLTGDPGRSTTQDLLDLLPGARIVKAFTPSGLRTSRQRAGG